MFSQTFRGRSTTTASKYEISTRDLSTFLPGLVNAVSNLLEASLARKWFPWGSQQRRFLIVNLFSPKILWIDRYVDIRWGRWFLGKYVDLCTASAICKWSFDLLVGLFMMILLFDEETVANGLLCFPPPPPQPLNVAIHCGRYLRIL